MARPIRMPPLGTTSDELRIVEWLKAEGDEVELGEPLLAVETDKATLEVESAAAGTLLRIVHGAGVTVDVGEVLAYVGAPGDEVPAAVAEAEDVRRAAHGDVGVDDASRAAPASGGRGVMASPAVRLLADEHGVDLARIAGSGPGGRVERQDVLAVAASASCETASAEGASAEGAWAQGASSGGGELVAPHRRALARRLERSAAIPQFSLGVTVDMTNARRLIEGARAEIPGLTYTHLLLQAVAVALRAHPALNVLWSDVGPRRRTLERADVGLAVAGDDALLVVTIPEPDMLTLHELVEQADRAASEARAGRVSERFAGHVAVTLSNLGMVGVDHFTAVIDPDQTAIVAAGSVVERPGALAGGVVGLLPQLELVLTADHRVVDGMVAGRFLAEIRSLLERAERTPPAS